MRIGMITGEFPPMQGGVGAFTQLLARHLAALGHELVILAGPGAVNDDSDVPVETIRTWGPRCYRAIQHVAARRQLEVLNLQYQTAAFGMSPAIHFIPNRVSAAPCITTFHDLRVPYLFPKAGSLRTQIVMHLANASAGVIATNPADHERLHHHPMEVQIPIGSNILSPQAADVRRRFAIPAHVPLIAFFGLINRSKGLESLLDAFERLAVERPEAHLIIIGSTGSSDPTNIAFAETIQTRMSSSPVGRQIQITGFLDEATVAGLLAEADVVALPFADGASLRRGSLMAALQAGSAIVTTTPHVAIPGLEDGVSALFMQAGDSAALCDAINRVLDQPEFRSSLKASAQALSRRFSWETIAEQTADFYSKVRAAWQQNR